MGYNTLGQLGAGNASNFSVPTLLGAGILTEGMVIAVGAGAFETVVVLGMRHVWHPLFFFGPASQWPWHWQMGVKAKAYASICCFSAAGTGPLCVHSASPGASCVLLWLEQSPPPFFNASLMEE